MSIFPIEKINYFTKLNIFTQCLLIFIFAKLILVTQWIYFTHTGLDFVNSVMRYDSGWFQGIIEHGYMDKAFDASSKSTPNQANWAFFPLFPLLTKFITLFGFSWSISAIIINQTQLFTSLYFAYLLAQKYLLKSYAVFVPLAIAFSPANIWFMAAYSDMTFLFLSILAFYCLSSRWYWRFALFGFLLALSRFVGFLIFIPLILNYWRNDNLDKHQILNLIVQILIIISGLLVFCLVLYFKTGDPIAFYHIQSAWGHLQTHWFSHPLATFIDAWNSTTPYISEHGFLIVAPIWLLVLIYYRYYEEASFSFFCLIIPVAAGGLFSYNRYSLGMYPLYLAISLVARKSYILGLLIILFSSYVSWVYWDGWLNGNWI